MGKLHFQWSHLGQHSTAPRHTSPWLYRRNCSNGHCRRSNPRYTNKKKTQFKVTAPRKLTSLFDNRLAQNFVISFTNMHVLGQKYQTFRRMTMEHTTVERASLFSLIYRVFRYFFF